jgi:hypothetical protein
MRGCPLRPLVSSRARQGTTSHLGSVPLIPCSIWHILAYAPSVRGIQQFQFGAAFHPDETKRWFIRPLSSAYLWSMITISFGDWSARVRVGNFLTRNDSQNGWTF